VHQGFFLFLFPVILRRDTRELTAVVALVLGFAPRRLAADLPSPQVLRDDGAVRMNRFSLKIGHNWNSLR